MVSVMAENLIIGQLVVVEPPARVGQVLVLFKAEIVVGRAGSDIVIDDPFISDRHALIELEANGQTTIHDLHLTNGTYVNDERLSGRVVLREGDHIRFADLVARFEPRSVSASRPDVSPSTSVTRQQVSVTRPVQPSTPSRSQEAASVPREPAPSSPSAVAGGQTAAGAADAPGSPGPPPSEPGPGQPAAVE